MTTQDVALTITTDQIHSWGLVGVVLIVLAAGLALITRKHSWLTQCRTRPGGLCLQA